MEDHLKLIRAIETGDGTAFRTLYDYYAVYLE